MRPTIWDEEEGQSRGSVSVDYTTVTNIFDGQAIGVNDQCLQSGRSRFDFPGSRDGSFDSSYRDMQENGPYIPETPWRQGHVMHIADGTSTGEEFKLAPRAIDEDGSDVDVRSDDRGSSLSSITHCFKSNAKGRMFEKNRGNDDQIPAQSENNTTHQADRTQTRNASKFQVSKLPGVQRPGVLRRDVSDPQPAPMPSRPPIAELVISSRDHFNETVWAHSQGENPTPSVISSSMSEYYAHELMDLYTRRVYRPYRYGFRLVASLRKRKVVIISSVLIVILAIVAIASLALSSSGKEGSYGIDENTRKDFNNVEAKKEQPGLAPACCVNLYYEGLDAAHVPQMSGQDDEEDENEKDGNLVTLSTPEVKSAEQPVENKSLELSLTTTEVAEDVTTEVAEDVGEQGSDWPDLDENPPSGSPVIGPEKQIIYFSKSEVLTPPAPAPTTRPSTSRPSTRAPTPLPTPLPTARFQFQAGTMYPTREPSRPPTAVRSNCRRDCRV